MSKPEDIPQDVRGDAAHIGATYRMSMAELAPRKAASLWGAPGVIAAMNETIARAIMAAEKRGAEREREACAALMIQYRELLNGQFEVLDISREVSIYTIAAKAIAKRGELA